MDFHGKIANGELWFSHAQNAMRSRFLSSCGTCNVIERITRSSAPKTHQQVKCHWGLVVGTIKQEFDDRGWDMAVLFPDLDLPTGYEVPADVIQKVLYAACSDVGEAGERKTLSKMSTAEASRFFEKCRDWAAIKWNIVIPDPNPDWKNEQAQTTQSERTDNE